MSCRHDLADLPAGADPTTGTIDPGLVEEKYGPNLEGPVRDPGTRRDWQQAVRHGRIRRGVTTRSRRRGVAGTPRQQGL